MTKALVLACDYFHAWQYIYRGYLHFYCILNPLIVFLHWGWGLLTLSNMPIQRIQQKIKTKKCLHWDLNSSDSSDQQRKLASSAVQVIFAFSLILVKPENNWHMFLHWSDVLMKKLELHMDKRNCSVDTWAVQGNRCCRRVRSHPSRLAAEPGEAKARLAAGRGSCEGYPLWISVSCNT